MLMTEVFLDGISCRHEGILEKMREYIVSRGCGVKQSFTSSTKSETFSWLGKVRPHTGKTLISRGHVLINAT